MKPEKAHCACQQVQIHTSDEGKCNAREFTPFCLRQLLQVFGSLGCANKIRDSDPEKGKRDQIDREHYESVCVHIHLLADTQRCFGRMTII